MTLLLGFAAVNTGNNLLYLLVSALLGFMAISGLLGRQNLQRLQVRVLPVDDVFATLPARVDIELHNRRRWLPAFLIVVEVGPGNVLFPFVAAGKSQRLSLSLTLPQRGQQLLPAVWLRSCFPINFFVRSRRLTNSQQLLVFPRPQAANLPLGTGDSQQTRRHQLPQAGIDGELRSIDDYRQGDPLKSVHWKLSARHADFKVKRQHRLGAPSLQLELEQFSGPLEQRISQCTFLVNQLLRQQRSVGLKLDHMLLPPASGRQQQIKLLTELARYGRR